MITGQGKMEVTKEGAKRESNEGRGRFDLLPYEAIEALAKWYEAGAKKYEDRNWEQGLSVKDCINRMIRHAIKAGNGWTDEDHLSAVMWNAAAAITMIQRKPECNDHPWKGQTTGEVSGDKYKDLKYNVRTHDWEQVKVDEEIKTGYINSDKIITSHDLSIPKVDHSKTYWERMEEGIAKDLRIDGVCNSLNAWEGLYRRRHQLTNDESYLDLSVILQQAQILIRTMEEEIELLQNNNSQK